MRLWLVGSVSIVIVASVVAPLVFSSKRQPTARDTPAVVSGAGLDPAPPAASVAARLTKMRTSRAHPGDAVNPAPDGDLWVQQVPVEAAESTDNEPPQFGPSLLSDPAALRGYLSGGNAQLAEAVLQAASRQDKELAAHTLVDIVKDGGEPRRLEVLQRLCASPSVDDTTRNAALAIALQDSDYGLVTEAVRQLSERSDATALGLLSKALAGEDQATKLFILESVASNDSAQPLLRQGLKDADEAVRQTAQAVLSLQDQPEASGRAAL